MTNEQLRMQMLAGVITESEYTAVINKQIEEADKESLNESMIGGIVGIGAINQIPATPKTDYEMAFEHFLGERYEVKPNRERDDIKDVNEDETSDMEAKVKDEVSMNEAEGGNEVEEFLNDLINTSIPEDSEEGEEVTGVWEASEYADEDAYDNAQEFTNAHKYITDKGGEITIEGNPDVTYTALPNGDIQYSLIVTLDEISMNEENDQNNDESSEITEVTNNWMKLIKTISDLIIKQKTADFPDKMKLHKQINAYGNQKVALETQLIDALAGLNQNAGLEGNNETIKSLLTQRSYNNEGKEVEEPNNY